MKILLDYAINCPYVQYCNVDTRAILFEFESFPKGFVAYLGLLVARAI